MRGKTHCTIGILASIQASIIFKVPISLFSLMISAIFSLLPDLDEPNSIVSDFFFKKNISKFIYKIIIYTTNIAIFFISIKINNNFYFSSIITFIAIFVIESKLTHNLLRKVFLSLIFILLATCLYFVKIPIYFIIFCLMLATFPWMKHRSFSHSMFSIIIIYFLLKQIELLTNISNLSFFGTISYASHMFLGDIFTKQGVPLFYPISDKKISLGFLRVGSFFSNLLEIVFVIVLVICIIYSIIKI
ncbi:metal-dependent hydrolase [Romboutsia weinsteinii]|uniref:Metal-dependent hydrolase n=1 Tax=Romboutsia weinsteinii TaxID=2020949 RepID=A0A371J7V4_9FIRM|nr:metal-dependent hydrolase [Romboutsia weinsteinii]